MGTTKAKLGGVTLANAASVSWTQRAGTSAPQVVWTVHEEQWDALKSKMGVPLALDLESESGDRLTWQGLYILREAPTGMPFHRSFVVSDVRWKWPRVLFSRAFNIPRRTGGRRIVGVGPVEVRKTVDSYGYAYTSLDDGKKWTARKMVEVVIDRLAKECGHGKKIDGFPQSEQRVVTVEGLDASEGGDVMLAHALRHAPGCDVTVDREGNAVIFDATDIAAGDAQLKTSIPRTTDGQIDRRIDLRAVRPSEVWVYFQREVEVRFDSVEESDSSRTTTYRWEEDPTMEMENVVPLPDTYTTIDGERVAQGTYVPFYKAVAAWNADLATASVGAPSLTLANIRKFWFDLESLWSHVGELILSSAQANWALRISAIRKHYRQTYKIPAAYTTRMRDMKPTRVGILDYIHNTRNPSRAWSQVAIEPTDKARKIGRMVQPDKTYTWINMDNYPGINGELSDNASSPASVEIEDADLGIIRINYMNNPHGVRSQMLPSLMVGLDGNPIAPQMDFSNQLRSVLAIDGHFSSAPRCILSSAFRVAVVFTATPFAPNDERRLFGYRVKPDDVQKHLGAWFDVGGGRGPAWHVAVPPNLMTARYAITNSVAARESAKRLFGFGDGPPPAGGNSANEMPGYSIINVEGGAEGGLLDAVAHAVAVAQWAPFVNHREGSAAVHFRPDVLMRGNIDSIRHRLDSNGLMVTDVSMSGETRPMDPLAFLPQALRTAILGSVGGGVA